MNMQVNLLYLCVCVFIYVCMHVCTCSPPLQLSNHITLTHETSYKYAPDNEVYPTFFNSVSCHQYYEHDTCSELWDLSNMSAI